MLNRRNRESGFTLIEVLVALVILSIGLLGLAGLQVSGLRGSSSAYMKSAAMIYANDMVDRIRANRADAGGYSRALGAALPNPADTVAKQDLVAWVGALQQDGKRGGLPGGDGSVVVVGSLVTVTVQWTDNYFGAGTTNVQMVTRL